MTKETKRLFYCAPARCWKQVVPNDSTAVATWVQRPWDEQSVRMVLSGSGWFMRNGHDFADNAAMQAAFQSGS